MRRIHFILFGLFLAISGFTLNNYIVWYTFDVLYEAMGTEKPTSLGVSSSLNTAIIGAIFAGMFASGIIWVLAGWASRLTKDKSRWKPRIFCILAALPLILTVSKHGAAFYSVSREEAIYNLKQGGLTDQIRTIQSNGH
jgi:hypothetical protein